MCYSCDYSVEHVSPKKMSISWMASFPNPQKRKSIQSSYAFLDKPQWINLSFSLDPRLFSGPHIRFFPNQWPLFSITQSSHPSILLFSGPRIRFFPTQLREEIYRVTLTDVPGRAGVWGFKCYTKKYQRCKVYQNLGTRKARRMCRRDFTQAQ